MDILQAIGNTSLVRLRKVVPPGRADILVKLEWENPTGIHSFPYTTLFRKSVRSEERRVGKECKSGEALMQMLSELHADGATVCIATHDPRWIAQAPRHLRLFDGRVVDMPLPSL